MDTGAIKKSRAASPAPKVKEGKEEKVETAPEKPKVKTTELPKTEKVRQNQTGNTPV